MQAAGIEDLFQHVILGPLQAHARGWCFGVTRIDVEQDATASSLWNLAPDGEVARLVDDATRACWDPAGERCSCSQERPPPAASTRAG